VPFLCTPLDLIATHGVSITIVKGGEGGAMSTENKTLVRRWFEEVWNKGRAAAIDEMLASDTVIHGLGNDDLHGPTDFKRFHAAYRQAYPDVTIQIDDLVAEGDMVAVRWTASGTHRGEGLGFPATNKHVRFSGMVFVRVEQGKLVEGWNNFDQLGMLQQLGVVNLPSAL
jgi:steroid delta-isomerase-like uncharacterized protein